MAARRSSIIPATRYTRAVEANSAAAVSAIFSRMAPNVPIVTPNCLRRFAYFTPSTKANFPAPLTQAPSFRRPTFSTLKAILCPLPISPSTFSTGTFASSRISEVVEEPWIPSFFSWGPGVTPSKVRSTRNAVKCSRSIFAKTV